MSDDIADAIENIENAEDLDEETREKLKKALADSEDSDGEDDPDETRVDPNPMGAQTDEESEGDGDEESSAEGEADEEAEAADEENDESDAGSSLDEETRDRIKQVLDEADDEDASADSGEEADDEEASVDSADDETDGFDSADEEAAAGAAATEFAAAGGEDAIGGIFEPEAISGDGDDGDGGSSYLGAEDVEGYDGGEQNPTVFIMGGFIVLLMVGFSWILLNYTEQGERMKHLFQGDLKAYEAAKAQQLEERFKKEQLANMPKYGNLVVNGRPKYANIVLDGRRQYGKIPKTGEWRPVLLTPTTQFQNLNVAEKHNIKVTAPNHNPKEWTLTEEMWAPSGKRNMNFRKTLTVNLLPESPTKQIEFQQRMQKDAENNYYGKVKITSKPKGAKIIFDGKPLLNEDGEQRTTPVTFEKAYWKDEESGEIKSQKVKVDMPPDRGHKIQLRITDDLAAGSSGKGKKGDGSGTGKVAQKKVGKEKESGRMAKIKDYEPDEYPKFVTPLERQMWTCNWKDGEVPEEPPYPKHCNYTFELNVDFNKIKGFIEHKKKERKEVKKRNDELKKKLKKLRKKLANQ